MSRCRHHGRTCCGRESPQLTVITFAIIPRLACGIRKQKSRRGRRPQGRLPRRLTYLSSHPAFAELHSNQSSA